MYDFYVKLTDLLDTQSNIILFYRRDDSDRCVIIRAINNMSTEYAFTIHVLRS